MQPDELSTSRGATQWQELRELAQAAIAQTLRVPAHGEDLLSARMVERREADRFVRGLARRCALAAVALEAEVSLTSRWARKYRPSISYESAFAELKTAVDASIDELMDELRRELPAEMFERADATMHAEPVAQSPQAAIAQAQTLCVPVRDRTRARSSLNGGRRRPGRRVARGQPPPGDEGEGEPHPRGYPRRNVDQGALA